MEIVESEVRHKEVHEAANWLDVTYPGWYNSIDVDTLDMKHGDRCIGAQIGVSWLYLTGSWEKFSGNKNSDVFAYWTPEWRREILARR